MFATIDTHGFIDTFIVGMIFSQLVACFKFDKGKFVGSITVNFVGGSKDENRFRAIIAQMLQEHQGACGVYRKIGEWFSSRPIMGGLRRRVNDKIKAISLEDIG
jgi:hypothetical protein